MNFTDPVQLFKALSDQTRLRCLSLLITHGELCACELTHALELAQPKISHHLANLRKAGLVSDHKSGLWTYYQLNLYMPEWVFETLNTTIAGIKKEEPFISDTTKLIAMPDRLEKILDSGDYLY